MLPEVIEIHAPAIGDIGSCHLTVRVDQPNTPLFVELSQQPIDYLVAVIQHQITNGDIHRRRPADQDGNRAAAPEGYSWSYSRNRLVRKEVWTCPTSNKRKLKTQFVVPVRAQAMSDDEPLAESDHPEATDPPEETSDGHSGDNDDDLDAPDQTPSCSGLQSGCDHDEAILG